MFCLEAEGPFISREHVLPQSLGNVETLLPKGVVCDRCNNGPLSVCDAALVRFPPFILLKTSRRIPNKKNRLPSAVFGSTRFHALSDGEEDVIYTCIPDEAAVVHREGEFDIDVVAPWSSKEWQLTSRALLKMGLEMLAYDRGKDYVMDQAFDGLRKAVLGGGYSGFVAFNKTNDVTGTEITLHYPPFELGQTGRLGLVAGISIFGMHLATAWPGLESLTHRPPQLQDAADPQIVRFPRQPSLRDQETVKIRATVSYGSRSGAWDQDTAIGTAITRLDRSFGD